MNSFHLFVKNIRSKLIRKQRKSCLIKMKALTLQFHSKNNENENVYIESEKNFVSQKFRVAPFIDKEETIENFQSLSLPVFLAKKLEKWKRCTNKL